MKIIFFLEYFVLKIMLPYSRGLTPRAFKLGNPSSGGWALTQRGVFKGGGGCLNFRFVNFITVCQQSFCSFYFGFFQRKCDSVYHLCMCARYTG